MAEPLRTFAGYEPPPDPQSWLAEHGVQPYLLADVAAKFHSRAAAAVFRDDSTLSARAALDAKTDLEMVLDRVHDAAALPHDDLVMYRAEDRTFWVYPAA